MVGEKIADAAGSVKPTISLKDPKDKVYNDLEKAISKITEIGNDQLLRYQGRGRRCDVKAETFFN